MGGQVRRKYAHPFTTIADNRIISMYDLARRNAFMYGFDSDGHAVFIRPTDKFNRCFPHADNVYVRRQGNSNQIKDYFPSPTAKRQHRQVRNNAF